MKHIPIMPEIVESVTINPNYEDIKQKKTIVLRDKSGFFMNREYDCIRVRKAYVLLKPQFTKLDLELYSIKDLTTSEANEFFSKCTNPFPFNKFIPVLDPVIVEEHNRYYTFTSDIQTVFLRASSKTLAKIKLMI